MTHVTFNEINKGYKANILNNRDTLSNIADGLKEQYRFACNNYGNTSHLAGAFNKMLCAVQTVIEALNDVENVNI